MKKAVWRLLDSGPGTAAWNMAMDEAMLLIASKGQAAPTLRLFSWDVPSLSIGSFQRAEDIDLEELANSNTPLVRRPTGGRAVLHDAELTYSVICPIPSPFFPSDLMGSYRVIGSCFLAGLSSLGVDASLVPVSRNPDRKSRNTRGHDPVCFSSPSWHEVLVDGRKLIGSAQRRINGAFLQQGSLLIGLDVSGVTRLMEFSDESARSAARDALAAKMTALSRHIKPPEPGELGRAIVKGFGDELGVSFVEGGLSGEEIRLAERLYSEKYSTEGWNVRRLCGQNLTAY